jgi:amino acid transporter
MGDKQAGVPSKGVMGALSIGIGGIVGGGFFATFGLTIEGAKGGTPLAFLIGGLVALLTAYSYIPLTLRYPGPGGTAAFIRIAFGRGLFAASINVLLILSYVAIMSVYAVALASYSLPYLPPGSRAVAGHVIASLAVIVLGLVNFAGAALPAFIATDHPARAVRIIFGASAGGSVVGPGTGRGGADCGMGLPALFKWTGELSRAEERWSAG